MKKIFLLIFLLFITGCMNYNELNDLAIIKSIGIEYNNDYYIYAEIIEDIDKDNIPKTKVIKASGKNMDELFNNIKLLVNKEIYLDHIDLLILDENLNNNNFQEITKYFILHQELRNDFYTIIGSDIENILNNAKYDEIEKMIINNKNDNQIIKISFEEIISKYLDHKIFNISKIIYDNEIKFDGNYQYINNHLERINHEKN